MTARKIPAALAGLALLAFAATAQAQSLPARGDLDRDGVQNRYDNDRDGDGLANRSDPNPNRWNPVRLVRRAPAIHRGGIADGNDGDRDGDGVRDGRDRWPNNPRRA